MNSSRINLLDLFKYFFALCVVYMHSFHSSNTHIVVDGLIKLSVPFFYICSGFFLCFDNSFFKRLRSYIYLYLFWMLIYSYLYVDNLGFVHEKGSILLKILKIFYIAFFVEGYFHLWYLLALIYGLIIIYSLKRFFSPSVIAIIAVVAYCWGLFGDSYTFLDKYHLFYPIKLIWGNTRNCLTYAFPFLYLGLLIKRFRPIRIKYLIVLLCGALSFYFLELGYVRNLSKQPFLVIFTPIVLCFLFLLIINLKVKIKNRFVLNLISTSDLCYFIHPLIVILVFHFKLPLPTRFFFLYFGVVVISFILHRRYKMFYNELSIKFEAIYNKRLKPILYD